MARARALKDPTAAAPILRSALDLSMGTPLSGITAAYAPSHRLWLAEQRLLAYEQLFDLELRLGRHAEVTAELFALVEAHPVRERFVMQLMVALYRGGRPTGALDVARALRGTLVEQYGLDPGRAVADLESAILRGDPSLDVPGGPAAAAPVTGPAAAPVPAQLPHDLAGLIGRPALLARLDEVLLAGPAGRPLAVAALTGMAGAGKTTLAVHWAHRRADRFPDGQLYANLRGFDPGPDRPDPAGVLHRFLVALGADPRSLPEDTDGRAALFRTRTAGRRMLIVLDNARDAGQVRPLLPGDAGCAVLITSRNRMPGLVARDGAVVVPVDVLTDVEARDLMVARLGRPRVAAEPLAVAEIVARCGRLPLALAIVVARAVADPHLTLAEIAADLGTAAGAEPPELPELRTRDEVDDVAAVLSWSYDTLSAPAAALFRALGDHPAPEWGIAAAASLAGVPADRARSLLAELTGASLVTEHAGHRYALHDLLWAYARERSRDAAPDPAYRPHLRRMVDHYLHSATRAALAYQPGRKPMAAGEPVPGVTADETPDALAWLRAERATLVAVATRAGGWGLDEGAWRLAWALGEYLCYEGHWDDWHAVSVAALESAGRLDDGRALASSSRNLARVLVQLGRHAEAQTHVEAARRHSTGTRRRWRPSASRCPSTRSTATCWAGPRPLNNIGDALALLGRFAEALAPCRAALAAFESGGDVHGIAAVHDTLGGVHHGLGDRPAAIRHYEQALAIRRETGGRHAESRTLRRLGAAHFAAGDRTAAAEAGEQALEILEAIDHTEAAEARADLAAWTTPNPAKRGPLTSRRHPADEG